MKIAVYPGSFDPVTRGHVNIIERASEIFDRVYVCAMVNSDKNPAFTIEEKLDYIRRSTKHLPNVFVESDDGLLVEYARSKKAQVIIKGLRALSDFDWEFQMALINKKLAPEIDTMFLTAALDYMYLSSTVVREMARYNADLTQFLPAEILDDVVKKLKKQEDK